MKTIASSQSLTVLMFLVAACSGSSSLGGGEESGGAGGSGGNCASCSGAGGESQGTGGATTGGNGGSGTGGTATGGSSGKGSGGTATGGSAGQGTGGASTGGGGTTGGTGGSGTGGTAGSPPSCNGNIAFADSDIEKYVAGLVGKEPPLRGTDVEGIREFQYDWTVATPLTSLRGLQCLKGLQRFWVRGPDVRTLGFVDLTALSELPKLSDVSFNALQPQEYGTPLANLDIAPLAKNQAITKLYLSSASLADISPLANLVNLSSIRVSSDRVTSLTPLEHLPLRNVDVFGRGITDIAPAAAALRANQGTNLLAISTSVSDWSPVTTIPTLTLFVANSSAVSDMAPFTALPSVSNIGMRATGITQIAVAPSVTILDIAENPGITTYEPLVQAHVRNLFVRGNNITDFTPFLAITSYDAGGTLDIRANPLDCTVEVPKIEALRARGVKVLQDCIP